MRFLSAQVRIQNLARHSRSLNPCASGHASALRLEVGLLQRLEALPNMPCRMSQPGHAVYSQACQPGISLSRRGSGQLANASLSRLNITLCEYVSPLVLQVFMLAALWSTNGTLLGKEVLHTTSFNHFSSAETVVSGLRSVGCPGRRCCTYWCGLRSGNHKL